MIFNKKIVSPAEPADYLHELDKKALTELKKIPLFDKLCSKFISIFTEPLMNVCDMSGKIRISNKQLPHIYKMLCDICEKLGIDIPNLYLELNRNPNAYTYGDKAASITITSGLLECCKDNEVYAVLAHECGHIACEHVLYHTMGQFILNGGVMGIELFSGNGILASLISIPLKLAFYHWMRCSEFSADRAAAICCGKAKPVVTTMMRLAGGTTHIDKKIREEQFLNQASDYQGLVNENKWNKAIEFFIMHNQTHPLLTIRAQETIKWGNTDCFKKIISGIYGKKIK